jgi:SHAQKYF class myb-like DNA-binding protein
MIKMEEQTPTVEIRQTTKKERQGRWSKAEKYIFECLLEKFGKNWARIHEQMPQRSLSQIRSHAQKFFERVGPSKV